MQIFNSRTGVVADNYVMCKSIWSQARGLMFSGKKNLVFKFKKDKLVPLHMFFVFFAIDVLFLDKDMRIVELKLDFKPFKYYRPSRKASYIIELPQKENDRDFLLGDQIVLK